MRAPLIVFLLLSLVTGVVYPGVVTLIGALAFPHAASGSILSVDGRKLGSELIGQSFDQPGYFWGRLSATGPVPYTGYNASTGTGSSGSNYGPLHPALLDAARARIEALRAAEQAAGVAADRQVPIDLVTASGSGLDPHISVAAAEYQVERVARVRSLSPEDVRALVAAHTRDRQFGVLGEPVVNVLRLNLALDGMESPAKAR